MRKGMKKKGAGGAEGCGRAGMGLGMSGVVRKGKETGALTDTVKVHDNQYRIRTKGNTEKAGRWRTGTL